MAVGRPKAHDSALLHVTGAAAYTADVPAPAGTLHLAFGLSPIARGRITELDLGPVRASPGVVAVFTAADLPAANDVSSSGAGDEPLLATGDLHYAGQPVFLVAARSHREARKAARAAVIGTEAETPVLTIDEALAAGWRLEDPLEFARGDPEATIASAPHRLADVIEIGGQEHFYLEGQAALALPEDDGGMRIVCSSQHPSEIQHVVAEALGLPMSWVRVEVRRMGGGFGGKESQGNALAAACAVAARLTGRPCRMRYDRDDDFVITGKRHDARIAFEAGFDEDGRILGVVFRQWLRCGWSRDLSLPVADRAMLHADNAYHLPAVRIRSERLRTNTQSATAFRGFGGPQGILGMEALIERIAEALGRDPLEVRRANFYRPPAEVGAPQLTPYHMPVEEAPIGAITEALAASADYARRRAEIARFNAANPILKRGIALTPVKFGISFTLTHLNQAGALVHVYRDGSIRLNHGGTEMGQGLFVKVAQVAAEVFGQPLERVRITATDTAKVPNTSATAASSGSDLNGMAVRAACETIRGRLQAFLAIRHQTRPEKVVFADGAIRVGDETLDFDEVVREAYEARIPLSATGHYATPKIEWDRRAGRGRPFYYFAWGAAVSEVMIDTLTGEMRLLRTDILHDVGRSLNPAIDIGQIEGGFVQGAGWLTSEELVWDEAGRLLTHAPSTYKIPACSDRPRVFNVALWDGENPEETIYRSKAVGEPPLMLGISVWAAIRDAVRAAAGAPVPVRLDPPATPERILRAVRAAQAAGAGAGR
ncbi:MAG: xanthine dehydrogenase molybdopterin binding subunit [Alphaproteobacteria bacterium]|nr:MAG: xanthine dehydrogenase molybdopterin binding subunit [Alphaproteobacteria bacterium]